MKILHIYKDYEPVFGGIENHMRDVAVAQAAQEHDVTVLVTQLPGLPAADTRTNGVRVVKARRQLNVQSAPIAVSFVNDVARLSRGVDIVHLHAPYPIGETANLIAGRGRKTVISWHSDIVRQKTLLKVYAPFLRRVLRKADRILPASEAYARSSPWLSPHLDKCTIVPYGVDSARFAAAPTTRERAAAIRAAWLRAKPDARLILLSVGRLRYYKGLDDLIRALPGMPDALVVLAGDGPMGDAWKALAHELGVADRVLFAGSPSNTELPAWFQAADAYVLPANSRAEAFGIAVIEAMASGLPVITTEVGSATSWINQDGVTGFVAPPLDPAGLAVAIGKLGDASHRARLGAAARARAASEFAPALMHERIMHVYRQLLGGERG
jgi:glycosyltransferase involved in cell wall biosynthesis